MFGENLLVAPLFETGKVSRKVYLPPGSWIDYQSGKIYEGGRWFEIEAGAIPIVLLVKNHTILPLVKPAQNTSEIDWDAVELKVFSSDNAPLKGQFVLPGEDLQMIELNFSKGKYFLKNDLTNGKIKWEINRFPIK